MNLRNTRNDDWVAIAEIRTGTAARDTIQRLIELTYAVIGNMTALAIGQRCQWPSRLGGLFRHRPVEGLSVVGEGRPTGPETRLLSRWASLKFVPRRSLQSPVELGR